MRLEGAVQRRLGLGIDRRPLDLGLELVHAGPEFGRARHPKALVVDHLVLGLGDFDFLSAAEEADTVEVYIGVGDSIYREVWHCDGPRRARARAAPAAPISVTLGVQRNRGERAGVAESAQQRGIDKDVEG